MTKQFTTLLLALLCFSLIGSAQERRVNFEAHRQLVFPGFAQDVLQERMIQDTLAPDAFFDECALNIGSYGINDYWGTISGMNELEDLEKAQLINNSTNTAVEINEVLAFFDYVDVVGNGNLRAKIYATAEDGSPSTLLGQSDDITASEILASPEEVLITTFPFTNSVMLDAPSFFVSIDFTDLYASQDTTGLLQTDVGCGSGAEAYEYWVDETWHSLRDVWSFEDDIYDVNLMIFAVVEFDETSPVVDPFYQQGHIRLRPANPNPASESVRLNYELEQAGSVQIEIYSPDGRRIESRQLGLQPEGTYAESVDLSAFAPGAYIYSIVTDEARVVSRFVVE